MPNINCNNKEYLLYLITEDIDIWIAKCGDAVILYKNDEIIHVVPKNQKNNLDDELQCYNNKLVSLINDDGDINLANNEENEKEFEKEDKPKKKNNIKMV